MSISTPKKAVPKAVAKTIKAVVRAFIPPMNLTPYISAQSEEPSTLAKPLHIPIKPKKKKAEKELPSLNSMIDKLAKNNIIHDNKAANLKSNFAKHASGLKK